MELFRNLISRLSTLVIIYSMLITFFAYSQNPTYSTYNTSDTDSDNLVFRTEVVTITATFSEPMQATPTINISGEINNAFMINGNDIILKPNNGWVSSSNRFNSNSNPYLFQNSLEFSYIDNQYIYKDFDISTGSSSVNFKIDYIKNCS